ncbi:MAG: ATP-binding protein [Gammaproteobacteria bacterium]|nr:ATP-binding protein [Gammaproteobacteria bacterium]MDH5650459.1 ATP-binding protein [Gammaproteobacteria bacterium]
MNSLRSRIIIVTGFLLTCFVMLAGFALDRAFYINTEKNVRSNLNTQLTLLMASAEVPNLDDVDMSPKLLATQFSLPSSGLYGFVQDGSERVLWASLSSVGIELPKPRVMKIREQEVEKVLYKGKTFYVISNGVEWFVKDDYVPLTFNIMIDLTDFDNTIAAYRRTLWGWLLALAGILLPAQVVLLFWMLSPLRRVIGELNAIEEGKQEKISDNYPKEILRLTENINGLLDSGFKQLKRYRNALADLAHSLKTPLATLNSAFAEIKDHPIYPGLLEQVERMDHIIAHQLQRGATAGVSPVRKRIDVKPVAQKLVGALQKVYREKDIQFEVSIADDFRIRVDEGDLMEVMGNLLDNACKLCRQYVCVSATREKGRVQLTVSDDGPGVDADQVEIILSRGGRLDQSLPGQGIGLSIVREIVQAYDGEIIVTQSRQGGAAFTVDWPLT